MIMQNMLNKTEQIDELVYPDEQLTNDNSGGNETAKDSPTVYNDSRVLRDTMMVYGSALIVVVLLFCWARLRFPKVYNIRNWVDPVKTSLAENQYGFFSWMWMVFVVTDDEMLDQCGMDALCFIRIAQMGYKLSAVGIFNSIWLMIVYATSRTVDENQAIDDGVVEVTIANVPSETPRLIATTLAAYVFFGYAMYLVLEDFEWFTEMRHKFLRQHRARNYSVFIRNIPEAYRSNHALEEFMRSSFSHESVLEARIAVTTGQLAKVEANRDSVVAKLEHAIAEHEITGKRPRHKQGLVGGIVGEEVDSIETYKKELTELNTEVENGISEIERKIESMSAVQDWGSMSHVIGSGLTNDDVNSMTSLNDMEVGSSPDKSKKPNQGGGNPVFAVSGALNSVRNTATHAVGGALGQAGNLASGAVNILKGSEDGESHPAGFVVFSKLATANAALQMVHHSKPFTMEIMEAPDPDDVNWLNIGRTHKDLQLGKLVSLGLTVSLCLLWTIPMTFIASLSSVQGLRDELEFIDDMLNKFPRLVPVFEVAAPMLVIIANSLLPIILEAVTLCEGPISGAVVEAALFVKLAAFMIIQTFFVSAVSGSVIDKISEMVESPTIIVDLLATSLPQQATYFMQITFVSTVISGGMELLRVVPVAMAIIRSFIGPRLTEDEKRTTFLGIRPLYDPKDFEHADFTSNAVFYFMVLLVYSVISPLTNFIMAFCFLVLGIMLRHQFLFIYPTRPDSGGKIWTHFIKIFVTCMIVAQVTMLGLLGLKKASIATPMFIPLLICTILFSYYIRQDHFRVAEYLPTRNCLREDTRRSGLDFETLKGSYLQPELAAERKVWPESCGPVEESQLPRDNEEPVEGDLN